MGGGKSNSHIRSATKMPCMATWNFAGDARTNEPLIYSRVSGRIDSLSILLLPGPPAFVSSAGRSIFGTSAGVDFAAATPLVGATSVDSHTDASTAGGGSARSVASAAGGGSARSGVLLSNFTFMSGGGGDGDDGASSVHCGILSITTGRSFRVGTRLVPLPLRTEGGQVSS